MRDAKKETRVERFSATVKWWSPRVKHNVQCTRINGLVQASVMVCLDAKISEDELRFMYEEQIDLFYRNTRKGAANSE